MWNASSLASIHLWTFESCCSSSCFQLIMPQLPSQKDAAAPCKICAKTIYLHEEPVHFKCYSAREKSLLDVIVSLRCEINAIKSSFKKVEAVFKSIERTCLENVGRESDSEPTESDVPLLKKTPNTRSAKSKKDSQPISPLVAPNGTSSSPSRVKVTKNRNITATTTVNLPPPLSGKPSPSAIHVVDVIETEEEIASKDGVEQLVGNHITYASVVSQNSSSNESVPVLKCIPPPRSIFLSGFDPELTEKDVKDYVSYNLDPEIELNVRKMIFKEPKPYGSFVIAAGRDEDLFEALCNPGFWPENAIVHEYEFFRKPRARATIPNRRIAQH